MSRESSAELVRSALLVGAELRKQLAADAASVASILAGADAITEAFRSGGKLLLCGNGGSAADCQHMAAEFVSRLRKEVDRPALPAIALTTDTSFLTAYTNDIDFDGVFERQVQAHGRKGDVLLGISTSGNSRNVIRAVHAAKAIGMTSLALLGEGGQLATLASLVISVPSKDTQRIQEAHLVIEHLLCELVENALYRS
jgi:D-sedoheptulose 7-phosphate isomerase